MSLQTLPYDLLFHIVQHLGIDDVHSLQATCRSLRSFTLTRPVYRSLAYSLLARSRPLPLPAFQRLADLATSSLIKAVDVAHGFEKSWRVRAPRPARSSSSSSSASSAPPSDRWYTKISAPPNEEIDWLSPITSSYTLCATKSGRVVCWDVARDLCLAEWDPRTLGSPFLRATGPNPRTAKEKKWELWKCRVEFDERAVYFTMARVLKGSYDDARLMEFVLMKLAFPPESIDSTVPTSSPESNLLPLSDGSHILRSKTPSTSHPSSKCPSPFDPDVPASSTSTSASCSPSSSCIAPLLDPICVHDSREPPKHHPPNGLLSMPSPVSGNASIPASPTHTLPLHCQQQPTAVVKPTFHPLTSFYTTGVVMNIFLLDPLRRLLSAFVWVATSNTIGLYVLLDWDEDAYVFVDTSIGCLISSNWSCILHEDQIVIHSEEADAAFQYFYPISLLRVYSRSRRRALGDLNDHGGPSPPNLVGSQPRDPNVVLRDYLPVISTRLPPVRSISKKFIFPKAASNETRVTEPSAVETPGQNLSDDSSMQLIAGPSSTALSGHRHGTDTIVNGDIDDATDTPPPKGSSRSKGKARDTSVGSESPSLQKEELIGKGKAREVGDTPDRNGHRGENEIHARPPASNLLASSATQTNSQQSTALVLVARSPDPAPNIYLSPLVQDQINVHQSTVTPVSISQPSAPAPNPYPFPPWYPESAHFVRQWWPTLPGIPRLSCTVVLLAAHDVETHRTHFVLAQHYFRVPIVSDPISSDLGQSGSNEDEMLHLWYVTTPLEVVCVLDSPADNEDDEETGDRPRPLVAVDFGHAVWVEYAAEPGGVMGVDASRLVSEPTLIQGDAGGGEGGDVDGDLFDGISDGPPSRGVPATISPGGDGATLDPRRLCVPKCLRFVTFPPVYTAHDKKSKRREDAVVRTLEIPEELDLDGVETINIDQSQGAVILSVKEGKIFILRYE